MSRLVTGLISETDQAFGSYTYPYASVLTTRPNSTRLDSTRFDSTRRTAPRRAAPRERHSTVDAVFVARGHTNDRLVVGSRLPLQRHSYFRMGIVVFFSKVDVRPVERNVLQKKKKKGRIVKTWSVLFVFVEPSNSASSRRTRRIPRGATTRLPLEFHLSRRNPLAVDAFSRSFFLNQRERDVSEIINRSSYHTTLGESTIST